MPVPKAVRRAAREGGNVGVAPTGTPAPPAAPAAPGPTGPTGLTGVTGENGVFTLEVKSAKLKENKKGPYRSLTGLGADGKLYWAPLDASHKPKKGQTISLKGEMKGTFGGEDGAPPYHKILGPNYFPEVVSITDTPIAQEPSQAPAQVSSASTDELQETLETLVKANGIGKILSVLGEIA